MTNELRLSDIEIVADRTPESRCDEGFLRLRRLTLRNRYEDGSLSADYACDIVSRPSADAVAICLHRRVGRRVEVILKAGTRAPVYLRKLKKLHVPERRIHRVLLELAAGILEEGDGRPRGIEGRAAAETEEEVGYPLPEDRVQMLGDALFASPGITDEKVFFCAADVTGLEPGVARGDGSVMEEASRPVVFELREAIRLCRRGDVPDMKTEVGLYRLADRIGYLPTLDCFVEELPEPLRDRHDALGAE